jgi:hypothetical protein
MVGVVVAILIFPVFFALALPFGLIFGAVGGMPSGVVAVWPILLYYHDRFLIPCIPARWTRDLVRRGQAYVEFYSPPRSGR